MFSKTAIFLAFVAVAEFAMATPPACMLETINTVKEQWKIEDVCKTKDITQKMAKLCGDNTKVALAAFADLCNKEAGVKVETAIATSTGASSKPTFTSSNSTASITGSASLSASTSVVVYTTASFDSDCNCTKTAAVTSTAVFVPSGIATQPAGVSGPTATGSEAPLSTGAAGKMGAGMAAVVLGGLGAVAAVL